MPCPFCEAPLLGDPESCPECGQALPRPAAPPAVIVGQLEPDPDPLPAVAEGSSVPGLIDSRLFGAFMPGRIETPQMAELETTGYSDTQATDAAVSVMPGLEVNAAPAIDQPLAIEQPPGLIDARLFGAYVPEGLETIPIEGIVSTRVDGAPQEPAAARKPAARAQAQDEKHYPHMCGNCGVPFRTEMCPICGAPPSSSD